MKIVAYSLLLVAGTILSGCKSTYQVQNYKGPSQPLPRDAAVFIGVRPDAYDEPGSGMKAAKALQTAFLTYAARAELSNAAASVDADLTNAAVAKCAYLLDTTILKWEEEPTEWTGKPDVLEVNLRLLQVLDGGVTSQTGFSAKSKWLTFGGDHVEDLLESLANGWVHALYEGGEFKAPGSKPKKTTEQVH